jgi:hypothetical protein
MAGITITGIASFLFFLLMQVAIWRLAPVRREIGALFLIYLVIPTLVALAAFMAGAMSGLELFMAWLLYMVLASGYIQTYPALREDTPSFRILFAIADAGDRGMTREEIIRTMGTDGLHARKLSDLKDDGLMRVDATGRASLSFVGRMLARVFRAYRSVLGLQRGRG